jgi:hypothetical protein
MQSFLKIIGFVTIFIGIFLGIYVIYDALSGYKSGNSFNEQLYMIKLIAGGAIILSSVVSGMLYLSFGIVIELLDSINHKFEEFLKPKKDEEELF